MQNKLLYIKIFVNLMLCILVAVLVIWLGPKLLVFFLPFVIAVIISAIANPLVNLLEKKVKILRKHSSAIIIVVVLALLFALLYLIILGCIRMVHMLTGEIDNIVDYFLQQLDEFSTSLSELSVGLPASIRDFISSLNDNIGTALTNFAKTLVEQFSFATASTYLSSALNVLVLIIITILATYFLMIDRNKITLAISRIVPTSIQTYYRMIVDSIKTAIGGYLKAQLKLMVVVMLALFLGFELLNVEYAFLLAFITAVLDFLPVFGTGAVLGPWAVIKIITGDYLYAVFLIIIYLVCLLLKQLLQPKMVGDSIGLSPLLSLIFMFIGYRLNGILGMIIGIPIGMIIISFYRIGFFNRILRGFKILLHDINEFRKY